MGQSTPFSPSNSNPENEISNVKCLIVDDDGLICMDLEEIVREYGVGKVDVANTLPKAIELAEVNQYDVALLDLHVGKASVLPVAEMLLARKTRLALVSGGFHDIPEQLKDQWTVPKPFSEEAIHHAIKTLLDGSAEEFHRV